MSFVNLYFDSVALYNTDLFPQIHFDYLQALYNEKCQKQKKQKNISFEKPEKSSKNSHKFAIFF